MMKQWLWASAFLLVASTASALDVEPRIIGGESAATGYEFYASLLLPVAVSAAPGDEFWLHFCGASYLGGGIVLTAAHCVADIAPGDRFAVMLGNRSADLGYVHCPNVGRCQLLNTDSPQPGFIYLGVIGVDQLPSSGFQITRSRDNVAVHPRFSQATLRNDVALIRLPMNAGNESIALTRRQQATLFADAVVVGHGDTRKSSFSLLAEPSAVLQAVALPTVADSLCDAEYVRRTGVAGLVNAPTMLCAGFANGADANDGNRPKDSCHGDSGGPLIYDAGSGYEQIGVVSWGLDCAKTYGVYADIKELRSWIVNKMNEASWNKKSGGSLGGVWLMLLSLPLLLLQARRRLMLVVAVSLLAGCSSMPKGAGEPEVLFNPEVTAEGFEFSVVSHGCTEDDHLFLRVEGSQLTLLRTQIDRCRTAPQLLRFVMPLPQTDNVWQIENPVRYSNRVGHGAAPL